MDFASSVRAAKTEQDGKGWLRSHLWYPNDLAMLWDRLEINTTLAFTGGNKLF